MSAVVRRLIENALASAEDNLYRFKMAARRPGALPEQWGESGKTLQEWVDGAQAEVDSLRSELQAYKP